MKIIFADMVDYRNPLYCKECARAHSGLTKITVTEAKGLAPNAPLVCADCGKDLESEE